MALVLEVIDAAGTVSRLPIADGRLDIVARPGSIYRIVDENGSAPGAGARVLRLDDDLVIVDLPAGETVGLTEFFSACSPADPCTLSLEELGGSRGETVTPGSEPIVALKEGGFLMNRTVGLQEEPPLASGSAFPWKPVAAAGAGILVIGAVAGAGGGGGDDTQPPAAPSLVSDVTNNPFPVLSGTAEAGSRVSVTITVGNSGQNVTYTTTATSEGTWAIDTATATPAVGALPAGGLPTDVPSTVNLVATDGAGNVSEVGSGVLTFDTTPPTAVALITGVTDDGPSAPGPVAAGGTTNDTTPVISGTLSAALGPGETVIVSRDGVPVGTAAVSGLTWSFTDPGLTAQGPVSYSAQVGDPAGNLTAAGTPFAFSVDTIAPVAPVIATPAAGLNITAAVAAGGVVVSGSGEAGTSVSVVFGLTPARTVVVNAQGAWTTTYTAAQLPADGAAAISVTGVDAAGNTSAAVTSAVAIDQLPPSVVITSSGGAVTNQPFVVTFTFSEPVTGFAIGDVVVTGGAPSAFAAAAGGQVYTMTVTPTPGAAGPVVVTVPAGAVADAGGNPGVAGTFSQPIDTTAPAVVITDNAAGVATGPITYTFTFSEPVTGFTAADVTVVGATAGPLVAAAGGATYTMVVTPPADETGTINVSVPAGTVADAAGNANAAPAAALPQAYNTAVPPTVVITDNTPEAVTNGAVVFTLTFSEPVTGLTLADLTATGGVASALTPAAGGAVYTVTVTPTPNVAGGNMVLTVPAGAAADANGNLSLAGQGTQGFDTRPPGLAISDNVDGTPPSAEPVLFTFAFTEPVTGFVAADVAVTGGTGGALVSNPAGSVYTMTVTPAPASTLVVVTVAAGAALDAAGNGSETATAAQPFGPLVAIDGTDVLAFDASDIIIAVTPDAGGSGYQLQSTAAGTPWPAASALSDDPSAPSPGSTAVPDPSAAVSPSNDRAALGSATILDDLLPRLADPIG